MSKTPTIPNAATIEAERLELVQQHEAALAALAAKQSELAALRAPVVTMLAERADLQAKLHNATANKELLQAGVGRWTNHMDEVFAADESARTFLHHAQMPQSDFLCAAGLVEVEKYIVRTRAQLDTINSKLASYCDRHGLEDLLPAN